MEKQVRNMLLLHNMQGKRHPAMTSSAEHKAVADKSAGLVRRKGEFAGLTFANLCLDAEFLEADTVRHIDASSM
jgi:hypothetical protein